MQQSEKPDFISVEIPRDLHKSVKRAALDYDKSKKAIVIEALETILKKYPPKK